MSQLIEILKSERGKKAGVAVLMAGFSAMFFFCGYEFVRSPIESIFLKYWDATAKPYAVAFVPVMMAALIYGYGILLSRLGAKKSMLLSMAISSVVLLLSWLFLDKAGKWLVFLVLIFKESYSVVICEQYWSFINSTLKDSESKIFNGPVAGISALGPLIGGWIIAHYAAKLGTDHFLLFAALSIIPAYILAKLAYERGGEPKPSEDEKSGKKGHLHISLLWENKTVMFIAMIIFSTQVVGTLLDFRWSQLVQGAIPSVDERTAYFGSFWMKVNIFSFVMQFFFTPIILKNVSRRLVLIIVPAIHVITCLALLFVPTMGVAACAFLLFKGIDYSLYRATKETLYITLPYDVRFRAKQVADAFMYRFAKGTTATVLSVLGLNGIKVLPAMFPGVSALFAAIWLGLSFPLTANKKEPAEEPANAKF